MNDASRDPGVDDRLQKLAERVGSEIAGLKRRNRSLRRLTGTLAVAVLAACGFLVAVWLQPSLLLDGRSGQAVVRSTHFVLTDADGRERGVWSVGDDGRARLELADREGQPRLSFTVLPTGHPGIAFSDEDGARRVVLGVLPDRTSTLVFADGGGTPRAVMGVSPSGGANLIFGDRSGEGRVGLGLDATGGATLLLPDSVDESAEPVGDLGDEVP